MAKSKRIRCIVHGDCPYIGTTQHIQIEYVEFKVLGNHNSFYRKLSYSCPYSQECLTSNCPVYDSAPEVPDL